MAPPSEKYACSFGMSATLGFSFQPCQRHAPHNVAGASFVQVRMGVGVLAVPGFWDSDGADWIWWSLSCQGGFVDLCFRVKKMGVVDVW